MLRDWAWVLPALLPSPSPHFGAVQGCCWGSRGSDALPRGCRVPWHSPSTPGRVQWEPLGSACKGDRPQCPAAGLVEGPEGALEAS